MPFTKPAGYKTTTLQPGVPFYYDPVTDPTRGQNPLFAVPQPLTLANGITLHPRRIGVIEMGNLVDMVRLLLKDGYNQAIDDLGVFVSAYVGDNNRLARLVFQAAGIVVGMLMKRDEFLKILAGIYNLEWSEFCDPDVVPATAIVDMLFHLKTHPEIVGFFDRGQKLQELFQMVMPKKQTVPVTDTTPTLDPIPMEVEENPAP